MWGGLKVVPAMYKVELVWGFDKTGSNMVVSCSWLMIYKSSRVSTVLLLRVSPDSMMLVRIISVLSFLVLAINSERYYSLPYIRAVRSDHGDEGNHGVVEPQQLLPVLQDRNPRATRLVTHYA